MSLLPSFGSVLLFSNNKLAQINRTLLCTLTWFRIGHSSKVVCQFVITQELHDSQILRLRFLYKDHSILRPPAIKTTYFLFQLSHYIVFETRY